MQTQLKPTSAEGKSQTREERGACPADACYCGSVLPLRSVLRLRPCPTLHSPVMSAPAPESAGSADSTFDEGLLNAAHDSARIDQELYDAQAEEIAGEVSKRPLVGPLEPLQTLESEYAENPKFIDKIRAASAADYPMFRRVRGDGSCFYRAYVFGILEWMSQTLRDAKASEADKQQVAATVKIVEASMDEVMKFGYERFTMEDFYEYFVEQFNNVLASPPTSDELAATFCDEGISQYVVSYARYLTSAYFQSHAQEYAPFLPEMKSPDAFKREVSRARIAYGQLAGRIRWEQIAFETHPHSNRVEVHSCGGQTNLSPDGT